MAKVLLPKGYRFHPTDQELVMHYLKRKVMGRRLPSEAVSEIKLYEYAPWEFREMSESKDLEWFFFCSPHRKYKTGRRVDRVAKSGYWKTTGKDKPIRVVRNTSSQVVGKRRTFVFHEGKAPKGDRTNWVMHEYRLEDKTLAEADASICQDRFVVCKIFEKSGRGPKNGEQYGAPFVEEDDDDSDDDGCDNVSGLSMTHPLSIPSTSLLIPEEGQDAAMISTTLDSGDGHDSTFPQHSEAPVVSSPEHDVHGDTSDGNDVQQAGSIVTNKTTIDDADTHVSLMWPEELNSIEWEDQNWLRQMLLSSIGEGCFIEMNDIDMKEPTKVEGHQACVSDLGLFANAFAFHSTPVLPAPKVMDGSSESSLGGMEAISDSALLHKKGEIQGLYAKRSLGKGKRSWECVCIGGGDLYQMGIFSLVLSLLVLLQLKGTHPLLNASIIFTGVAGVHAALISRMR